MSLASDESSDRWVAFTMNGSLEMGNVCAHDTTSSSQCSVSKRTPEIHNCNSQFLLQDHRNTNKHLCIFILLVGVDVINLH